MNLYSYGAKWQNQNNLENYLQMEKHGLYCQTKKFVRPMGSKGHTASIEYKEGNAVKVKWGSRCYDAELLRLMGEVMMKVYSLL